MQAITLNEFNETNKAAAALFAPAVSVAQPLWVGKNACEGENVRVMFIRTSPPATPVCPCMLEFIHRLAALLTIIAPNTHAIMHAGGVQDSRCEASRVQVRHRAS